MLDLNTSQQVRKHAAKAYAGDPDAITFFANIEKQGDVKSQEILSAYRSFTLEMDAGLTLNSRLIASYGLNEQQVADCKAMTLGLVEGDPAAVTFFRGCNPALSHSAAMLAIRDDLLTQLRASGKLDESRIAADMMPAAVAIPAAAVAIPAATMPATAIPALGAPTHAIAPTPADPLSSEERRACTGPCLDVQAINLLVERLCELTAEPTTPVISKLPPLTPVGFDCIEYLIEDGRNFAPEAVALLVKRLRELTADS